MIHILQSFQWSGWRSTGQPNHVNRTRATSELERQTKQKKKKVLEAESGFAWVRVVLLPFVVFLLRVHSAMLPPLCDKILAK